MFFSFKHLIISFLLVSSIIHSNGMEKMVFSEWNKPEINIFYKLPNKITENTKIIFVIHATLRPLPRNQ